MIRATLNASLAKTDTARLLFRGSLLAAVGAGLLLAGCERPPVETKQGGFRGLGMEQVINPRIDAKKEAANRLPDVIPAAPAGGPLASSVYQNIQVLKDLNVAQFSRVMLAITQWVAPPEQSCNYCHTAEMASDARYTKVVSRRMLQMVRHINSDWKTHVGDTGVTCYTCHRGNAVPQHVWFTSVGARNNSGLTANTAGQDAPLVAPNLTSLPYDPFSYFMQGNNNIRVVSVEALPGSNRSSIKEAENSYSLMIHFSEALGVNCTYCHNSRSFFVWDQSTPKRATAWYAIRMARDLNDHYLTPLKPNFPAHRLGLAGDVGKVNCATCHQGVFKPLYGESMAKSYPELQGVMHPPVESAPSQLPAPGPDGTSMGSPAPTARQALPAQTAPVLLARAAH